MSQTTANGDSELNALAELCRLIRLESLDDNLFRGTSPAAGRRIYGGLVLAQALAAADATVADELSLHSMHAYFMRPGDPYRPVIYDVDKLRDGKSFSTRAVVARQHGGAIFSCQMSFQRPEQGFEHQLPMPAVPQPDELLTDEARFGQLPGGFLTSRRWPIEYRQVDPVDLLAPQPAEPQTAVWLRAKGVVDGGPALHRQLFAYASDMHILATAMRPHGVSLRTPELQAASLDHAIWFHRPFRIDEWLLYVIHSPSASGARGLGQGHVYTQDGELVASVCQEGLMRLWS